MTPEALLALVHFCQQELVVIPKVPALIAQPVGDILFVLEQHQKFAEIKRKRQGNDIRKFNMRTRNLMILRTRIQ